MEREKGRGEDGAKGRKGENKVQIKKYMKITKKNPHP